MPKWKGKQVSRKRYFDLAMNKEFREFVKARRTVYVPRSSACMYVNDQEVAKVTDVKIERPWDIPPFQWADDLKPVTTSRAIGLSELTEEAE